MYLLLKGILLLAFPLKFPSIYCHLEKILLSVYFCSAFLNCFHYFLSLDISSRCAVHVTSMLSSPGGVSLFFPGIVCSGGANCLVVHHHIFNLFLIMFEVRSSILKYDKERRKESSNCLFFSISPTFVTITFHYHYQSQFQFQFSVTLPLIRLSFHFRYVHNDIAVIWTL